MGAASDRLVFLLLSLAVLPAVLSLPPEAAERFRAFSLGLPAPAAVFLAAAIGVVTLSALEGLGFRRGVPERPVRGLALAAALASLLAAPPIVIDLTNPFAADINTPLPEALLFYPAIAIVAEAALHLLPLALVFAATRSTVVATIVAALTEPIFQTAFAPTEQPAWQTGFVALHVFVFGAVGLTLYRRYGLVALIGLRVVYYLWWHIFWGAARLSLLF
ncbi:hypothetical protein [Ostreiculturibacter nitratireducens]|uniref:hypothetical protein n=1 Tax=Ostreiculturibacter nitratireducens TaxID=3075226 RepID=UPI0031B57D90